MKYIFKVRFEELGKLQKGRNDKEFMESIGMDASTLSKIKSGKAYPSRDFIANILGHYPNARFNRLFYLSESVTGIKEEAEAKAN